jgi:hypothetical protein
VKQKFPNMEKNPVSSLSACSFPYHHCINSPFHSLALRLKKKKAMVKDHPFLHTPLYKVRLQEAAAIKKAAIKKAAHVELYKVRLQEAAAIKMAAIKKAAIKKAARVERARWKAQRKQERRPLRRWMHDKAFEVGAWPVYPSYKDDLVEQDPTPELDSEYPRFKAWMKSHADIYWTLLD